MEKLKKIPLVLLATLGLGACGNSDSTTESESEPSNDQAVESSEVLTIGAIPDYDASELNRAFGDFTDLISEELGIETEYIESTDYASVVASYERGDIDLVWFGGLTGAQAINAVPNSEAFAQRPQDEHFQSVFIKNTEIAGNVEELTDIAGHSFTFGSESSTSGHIMPRYFMQEEGVIPEEDFEGQVNYSGSHDVTMELVQNGSYDLGVVNIQYWNDALEDGTIDEELVEAFYTSPEYYDYNWQINTTVDDKFGHETKNEIKELVLNLEKEDTVMMEVLSADEFIETENENYQTIAEVAQEIGILE